jgi:hypothetical protein
VPEKHKSRLGQCTATTPNIPTIRTQRSAPFDGKFLLSFCKDRLEAQRLDDVFEGQEPALGQRLCPRVDPEQRQGHQRVHREAVDGVPICNWFYHPVIRNYFEDRGIGVNEEVHALSAMIQWIWRSQVRRGDPVTLFIPSERMRSLLQQWLSTSSAAELIRATEHEQQRAA